MLKSRLGHSVWESFVSRFARSNRLARKARRSLRTDLNKAGPTESLEQRVVLAASPVVVSFSDASSTLSLVGSAANDVVSVKAGTAFTDVLVNGKFLTRMNGVTNSQIQTVTFDGGAGGTDSLSISGISTALTVTLTGVEKLGLNTGAAGVATTVTSDAGLALLASTVSGPLNLTLTAGNVTQSGKVTVAETTTIATAATGNITLNNASNSFGTLVLSGNDLTIKEAGPTNFGTTTAAGLLSVTSTGAITDTGVVTVATTSTITSNGNLINLDGVGAGSSFGGTLTLKGTDVTIKDSNGGTALGAVTATGALTVESTTGAVTHPSGNITVAGLAKFTAAAANDITLTAGKNNFGTLQLSGANVAITEKSATTLFTTGATGTLAIISSGAITDTGVVTVGGATTLTAAGNAIKLDSATSTYGGTVTFVKGTDIALTDNDGATDLGASVASGSLSITLPTAGAGVTQSGTLTVAGLLKVTATGSDITLADGTNKFGSVSVDGKDVDLAEFDATNLFTSTATGTFDLASGGAVTDSGKIAVTGATTITATGFNITLDTAESTFVSTVALDGFNVAITDDDGATDLEASTATGNLSVTTTGAGTGVVQSDAVTVTGRLTVTANDAAGVKDIVLSDSGNAFGSISVFGNIVTLVEADASNLFTSSATSTFELTSGGAVTDSGDLTITGSTTIDAGANNITLDSALTTLTGDLILTGNDVSIFNDTATGIGETTTTGFLNITSNGAINDNDIITVAKKTTLNALGHNLTIDDTTNVFSLADGISLFGDNVTLTTGADTGGATGNVALATTTVLGTFDLTTEGAITDIGTIKVGGTTTITATDGVVTFFDVTLDSSLNSFGELVLTADDVIIKEFGETEIGTSTVSSLKVTSSGGIEDSGVLTVTNLADLTANGGDLILDESSNFGSLKVLGSNISVIEASSTLLHGVNTAGNFNLTTTGAITQDAGISVGGDAIISAATLINLNETGGANNFGTLDFHAGTSVVIHESSSTDLEASEAGTTLTILSLGNITATGVVTAPGATDLNASGNSIDLSVVGSQFGSLKLQGNAVTINDGNATNLTNGTNVTGALTLISGGAVTQTAGGITVGGLLSIDATGDPITLTDGGNVLNSISVNGSTVQVTDSAGDIILVTSNITVDFTLISAGNVTDSDLSVITVGGITTITAALDITLDEADSTYSTVVLAGANIELNSYSALTLGTITGDVIAGGTLTIRTFNGGAITQESTTAQVTAGDDAFISADGTLTLVQARDTFNGAINHFFSNGAEVF